jgi:hypothetical protein
VRKFTIIAEFQTGATLQIRHSSTSRRTAEDLD